MRVSTARVTTEPPDPVGQLFNDGPRQVVTYAVNTDPLSVLFRDPAFIVKLSPPEQIQPSTAMRPEPVTKTDDSIKPTTVARTTPKPAVPVNNEPMVSEPVQKPVPKKAEADKDEAAPIVPPPTSPKPLPMTETASAPAAANTAPAPATVAVAAIMPAKQTSRPTMASDGPIVLDGLKQNGAGWPIATKPANVFGSKGPDGTAWRGLVYKSPAKTPVKAIGPGKVVFAQPMRGYGNMIIVDHGKQYASIYGYNQSLTKQVGDIVRKGETLALVGDTGQLADDALYFEIRKGSLPINPSIYLSTNP
jgi:murein DD-endopeptidase MepM/ murein hydrolase activator NlpD